MQMEKKKEVKIVMALIRTRVAWDFCRVNRSHYSLFMSHCGAVSTSRRWSESREQAIAVVEGEGHGGHSKDQK